MVDFLRNALRIVTKPKTAWWYGKWCVSRLLRGRSPNLVIKDVVIGNFVQFGEYLAFPSVLSEEDIAIYEACAAADLGIAFDVGANIGGVSLLLAALGYRVYSFEPAPSTYSRFLQNLSLNPGLRHKIQPVNVALSICEGLQKFAFFPHSCGQSKIFSTDCLGAELMDVPASTVDEFCLKSQISQLSLIKIDVEGYESHVLMGAERMLSEGRIHLIYVEVISEALLNAGSSEMELFKQITRYDFRPATMIGGKIVLCSMELAQKSALVTRNMLFARA